MYSLWIMNIGNVIRGRVMESQIVFDADVEKAALVFFGEPDADNIAACRGLSCEDAIKQIKLSKERTREAVRTGQPIQIDGQIGVLMWYLHYVEEQSIDSTRATSRKKSGCLAVISILFMATILLPWILC